MKKKIQNVIKLQLHFRRYKSLIWEIKCVKNTTSRR